jgi:pimeloyl-ACP methyl ester carboxylesterase
MRVIRVVFLLLILAGLFLSACRPEPLIEVTPVPPTPTYEAALATDTPGPTETPAATETVPPTETPEPVTPATFEEDSCPFELPSGQVEGVDVECGYLVVPENRAEPAGRMIRIAVAIFRYTNGRPEPDPIIYLEGGPGGSALEFINLSFDTRYEPVFAARRDIIVFDQRGVGFSEPALDCPEYVELGVELLNNEIDGREYTAEEMYVLSGEALAACAEDLRSVADLTQYNSNTSAADVNDLRRALGYEQVNLWGISYGTRLALEVMRDYPAAVRSVVLDSVVPPDIDVFEETPLNAKRAFDLLFDGCAANADCSQAYPNLREVFFETVERLNAEPAQFITNDPLAFESYDTIMDGDSLVSLVFNFLYDTDIITLLPQIISETSEGDYSKIGSLLGALIATRESSSDGMNMAVNCHEEYPFSSEAEYDANVAQVPELAGWFEFSSTRQNFVSCPVNWQAGQADASENQAVNSDIPTLVMSGEYDPITPPAYGERAAETLVNSFAFTYPGVGHGSSTVEGCPNQMFLDFIKDPTTAPDSTCIMGMDGPAFAVPLEAVPVELESFSSSLMNIQGVVPVGWEEVNTGVYARNSNALDAAVVLAQSAPASVQQLLASFTQQLELPEVPQAVGTRQANDLTWTMYSFEVQGLKIDMALAERGGQGMVVLLQSDPKERDKLFEEAFLPMVEALRPRR